MAGDHFEKRPHPDGALDWSFNIIFDDQPQVGEMAEAYNRDHNQEKELGQQLAESSVPPVKFRATKLSLIKQAQTLPFYQWKVIQNLPIGSQTHSSIAEEK